MERIKHVMDYLDKHLLLLHDTGFVFDDESFDEMIHAYGVAYFCSSIAFRRGLNAELAFVIGLLHDIGRVICDDYTKAHGVTGALIAEKFLSDSGLFDPSEIALIVSALQHHTHKKKTHQPYDEVLKDADLMERFFFVNERNKLNTAKRTRIENEFQLLGLKLTGD